jgi:hypothetical protein
MCNGMPENRISVAVSSVYTSEDAWNVQERNVRKIFNILIGTHQEDNN